MQRGDHTKQSCAASVCMSPYRGQHFNNYILLHMVQYYQLYFGGQFTCTFGVEEICPNGQSAQGSYYFSPHSSYRLIRSALLPRGLK